MGNKLSHEELGKRILSLEQAELKCRIAVNKFNAIFNASPVIIGLSDFETSEYVEVNQEFYDTLGFTPDEVIGKRSKDVILLDESFRTNNVEKLKKDGSIRNVETIITNKKNEKIHVLFSAQVLELEDKKYILATAINITTLKRFEELQKFQNALAIGLGSKITLEEILKEILSKIFTLDEFDSGGIYLVDQDTGNLDFKVHQGLSGKFIKSVKKIDPSDIRTQMVMKGDLVYLSISDAPEPIKKDLKLDNIHSIVVVPIKFGDEVIGSINLASHSHEIVSGISKEILESISKMDVGGAIFRVLADDIIRKSEEKYRDIFENLMDVYFRTSLDGKIVVVSPSAEAILGYTIEELIGKKTDVLYQNPQDRQGLLSELNKNGKVRAFELLFKKKTGEPYHISVNADLHYNEKGEPSGLSGTIRDITENKLAQKEKLLAQEIGAEQEKNALIGLIAGQMAHDFNNILGIIMGNTELSLIDCKDVKTRKTLELIFEQSLRGRNLTRNLVAFAKNQDPNQKFFRINKKIDLVIDLLKKDLQGIEVIKDEKAGMLELFADPGMFEHGLVNLLQNSIHALSTTQHPRIIIRTYEVDHHLHIELEDNGCGIPQEHINNIYDPSFTLKGGKDVTGSYQRDIKGTGYGMANVKKYIEQHNGSIFVESKLGSGTKFKIEIPIIRKELTRKEKIEIKDEISYFKKNILLVEDEQSLSDLQYRLLTNKPGCHTVDTAFSGQIAIDLFNRNEYDCISLDYALPDRITGKDVYNHIRNKNKSVPILFISGNIEFIESIRKLKENDPYLDHLSKPCKNVDYLFAINELLGKIPI